MLDSQRKLLFGLATGLVTALVWGSWAVVSRLGLTSGLDFYDVTALRFGVAGVVLAPVLLRRGIDRRGLAGVPWRAVLLMWIGAGVPYALIVFAGLEAAPASHQAIIGPACVMLFTVFMGWVFLGEPLDGNQLVGMGVILAGVLAIGWRGIAGGVEIGYGHLLFVLAGFCWALFTIAARAWRVDAVVATAIAAVVSMVVYLPFYLIHSGARLLHLPLGAMAMQGVFQGLLAGVFALFLYMRTVDALGAGRAALFTALVPAMAAVLAVPVLGEPITTTTILGTVLVSAGMLIAIGRGAGGPGRAAATAGQNAGVLPGSKPLSTSRVTGSLRGSLRSNRS